MNSSLLYFPAATAAWRRSLKVVVATWALADRLRCWQWHVFETRLGWKALLSEIKRCVLAPPTPLPLSSAVLVWGGGSVWPVLLERGLVGCQWDDRQQQSAGAACRTGTAVDGCYSLWDHLDTMHHGWVGQLVDIYLKHKRYNINLYSQVPEEQI
jgi:hypothetical protein